MAKYGAIEHGRAAATRWGFSAAALIMAISSTMGARAATPTTLPDWNGVWVLADGFMDRQDGTSVAAPGRFDPAAGTRPSPNPPALKGEYLKRALEARKAQSEGKPIEDTGAMCLPQGMPAFWGGPYAFEIIQTKRQLNVYQEWNEQTRRIYIDGRAHPPADILDPSFNGHSVGTWHGAELTVDTVAIREDTALRNGLGSMSGPHSDAIHITERFVSEGPDKLRIEETVTDEKALSAPWVLTIHLHRKTGMEIAEYVCEENNRNPVGADGVTKALLKNQ